MEEFGETKEMTFIDLLAAIGGSMGLFAGISILSIFEVFGELGIMRLLPRCWGDRRLFGLGSYSQHEKVPTSEATEDVPTANGLSLVDGPASFDESTGRAEL